MADILHHPSFGMYAKQTRRFKIHQSQTKGMTFWPFGSIFYIEVAWSIHLHASVVIGSLQTACWRMLLKDECWITVVHVMLSKDSCYPWNTEVGLITISCWFEQHIPDSVLKLTSHAESSWFKSSCNGDVLSSFISAPQDFRYPRISCA